MPIQAPQWTEFLSCPVCCHDFDVLARGPISLGCGHTICRTCLANLHRKQCPFDQSVINTEIERLPVNEALLQLVGNPVSNNAGTGYQKLLPSKDHADYLAAKCCIEELALYLKPCQSAPTNGGAGTGLVSRPMQRKLVTLVGCQLVEPEGRARAIRAARSLGERSVTELILQHQNPQQLSANLWAAVRARGCQFLGPAMQEEVLKLVLLALEDGSALSRKVLVMFVVQRLEPHFTQASKTSIGHVVQLLYRASCFKVSKREGDSSLMQLKEEFRTYEALRREHDAQIVQIATEAGLRIAPDQWSALLYGDTGHKSHMQSIIDKLQTPQSFAQSVQELVIALQRTPDPGQLSSLRPQLELLASIDPSPESESPPWQECRAALEAVRTVVSALVDYIQLHGNRKCQEGVHNAGPGQPKYKVSMCRDLALRGSCPRSSNCTFAHSDLELDKYRSKNRKLGTARSNNALIANLETKNDKFFAIVPTKLFNNEQCEDTQIHHHGVKRAENNQRKEIFGNSPVGKANQDSHLQQPVGNIESPIGSLTNYMPQTPQTLPHVIPAKNVDVQCSHYIMHGGSLQDFANPNNLHVWDATQVPPACPNGLPNNGKKQRSVAKTLAILLQRRMEIINQLENIVGKPSSQQIKMNHDIQGNPMSPNCSIWTNGPQMVSPVTPVSYPSNYRRPETMLIDDEFVPFEAPPASKYGPISRVSKPLIRPNSGVQGPGIYGESIAPPLPAFRPIPTSSPVTSWYYGHQPAYAAISSNVGVPNISGPGISDAYIALGHHCNLSEPTPSHLQLTRHECMSKDLILESQKVKQQLKHLEKKINDLKMVTQGAALTEGERLTQELQMIEAGIREKEKDVRNWSPYGSVPCIQQSSNTFITNHNNMSKDYKSDEEDTYEAGIVNDMRELELRWDFELQEQEKRWSNEDRSSQK